MILRLNSKTLAASSLFAAAFFGSASAQQACSTYVVQDGDTIGTIAIQAYGTLDYQIVFNANRERIGNDISGLKPGTELILPCPDGRLTADAPIPDVAKSAEASASRTTPAVDDYKPKVKFVTGGDWYPFTDEGLTGGGFLIRLVETAMHRAGNDRKYLIGWVDDWDSHMSVLLPAKAYDLSIAWYAPDCGATDTVSEMTQDFCDNYLFSKSLYDAVFGFFTRADSPYAGAKTIADYKGARICRPEGYSMHDLDAAGLIEPAVTISIPPTLGDCAEGVVQGRYDVMSVESQAMVSVRKDLGLGEEFVENAFVTSIQAISAMASRKNARALEFLTELNAGLDEMRDSGEWYDIVASSLKEANEKLSEN
ncbi:transporter substrate-binding domain-containing protein [Albidovulum sediminicola]|uniref:Transporter substrate-binding domain-containing protein n=1 Tax=Albidovulum sediminicola TaxID=2984331 RepID=A0ABT2Z547_9RHOB|nr:transporter substrate-binding domain-containing protein [Defluviimonas sp. WL0075]MCV2866265.1 transporter substrate-binding domain-containing protein [Defluviimonas sp. WL0075]